MKKTPNYAAYDLGDSNGYEFDPEVDFSQFLEEARQNAREGNSGVASLYPEETGNGKLGEEKRIKKSWKNSLFSWWKADKKGKPEVESQYVTRNFKAKQGDVSGPIHGSGWKVDRRNHRRTTSGPITSLYNPMNRMKKDEMPYMCLNKLSSANVVQSCGPLYLVT